MCTVLLVQWFVQVTSYLAFIFIHMSLICMICIWDICQIWWAYLALMCEVEDAFSCILAKISNFNTDCLLYLGMFY